MIWSHDWAWSLPLIVLTTVIHVIVLGFASAKGVEILSHSDLRHEFLLGFCVLIGTITFIATLLLAVESALWAMTYQALGATTSHRAAMLYSLSAITCYGHANVFLAPRWQMMGALEALNGIILFGLTTAFFYDVIQAFRPLTRREVDGGR